MTTDTGIDLVTTYGDLDFFKNAQLISDNGQVRFGTGPYVNGAAVAGMVVVSLPTGVMALVTWKAEEDGNRWNEEMLFNDGDFSRFTRDHQVTMQEDPLSLADAIARFS